MASESYCIPSGNRDPHRWGEQKMGTWESESSMEIVTKGTFTLAGADGNSNGVPLIKYDVYFIRILS